jgi:hypothetical protein
VSRMASLQDGGQLLGLDLAGQHHGRTSLAPPPSRRLVGVEVVIDRPPADAVPAKLVSGKAGVVVDQRCQAGLAGLEGGDPHHGRDPPGRNALVCGWLSSMRN